MYKGKYQAPASRRKSVKKPGILLISLMLLLGMVIGGTAAYLLDATAEVKNTFTPANVAVEVKENFNKNKKSDVYLHNASNVKVYVRATLVEYWMKGDVIVPKPAGGEVYITWNSSLSTNWYQKGNIYYYKTPLDADKSNNSRDEDDTKNLIDEVTAEIPNGYTYHLDILAEAIQAEGVLDENPSETAVFNAWGIQPNA